jgi:3-deoxy-manno-octulosonate cytidylyltransferase (CMP-KDO synthetase)
MIKAIGIISVRMNSERFPGKPLIKFNGKTILQNVYDNIVLSKTMDKIIVATDSIEIIHYCVDNEILFFDMRDIPVKCGTERVWYVANDRRYNKYKHFVYFPGDEPLINPVEIKRMWDEFKKSKIDKNSIYTCWSPFYSKDRLISKGSCKIVASNDRAIYFSRNVVPGVKDKNSLSQMRYMKHVGIFIFSKRVLDKNTFMWCGKLSEVEGLEQLSFIEQNVPVKLLKIDHKYYGIDTIDDLRGLEKCTI